MSFVRVISVSGGSAAASGIYQFRDGIGDWLQVSPADGHTLEWVTDRWNLVDPDISLVESTVSGDSSSPATADWVNHQVETFNRPGQIPPTTGSGGAVESPGSLNPVAPSAPTPPENFLSTAYTQNLSQAQRDQLAVNWPEAVAGGLTGPTYDVIVVDGDSRSAGDSTGEWPLMLASESPFDSATMTIVAESGARTWERIAAFSTDVTPHAPTDDERGLYFCYLGVNDVFQIGGGTVDTPKDVYDNLETLWIDARALGFQVVAFTLQQHSFAAAGISEPEQRQEQLNKLILANPDKYDFLVPLHELLPDETVYGIPGAGQFYIHSNTEGNQFIADQVARIVGNKDRQSNTPPEKSMVASLSLSRAQALCYSQSYQALRNVNLSACTESTATGGTVSNQYGAISLQTTASANSRAGIITYWPLFTTGNNISWDSDRYRGFYLDFVRAGTLNEDVLFEFMIGHRHTWNGASVGFQMRRDSGTYQIRARVFDDSDVEATSSWVSFGSTLNYRVMGFAKNGTFHLFYAESNGAAPISIWREITLAGGPVTDKSRDVTMNLVAGAAPAGTARIDLYELQLFESEFIPFERND